MQICTKSAKKAQSKKKIVKKVDRVYRLYCIESIDHTIDFGKQGIVLLFTGFLLVN